MVFLSQREKHLWSAAGFCLVLIYLSAFVARPIANYLRDRDLLRLFVAMIFVIAAVLIALRLVLDRPGWRALVSVGFLGLGYALLLLNLPMLPEERIHFLEYGVIAALIYFALVERRRAVGTGRVDRLGWFAGLPPFPVAVIATGLAGWLDEGIQAVLPDRYYDLRDVAFNTLAAFLALGSVKLVQWVQQGE